MSSGLPEPKTNPDSPLRYTWCVMQDDPFWLQLHHCERFSRTTPYHLQPGTSVSSLNRVFWFEFYHEHDVFEWVMNNTSSRFDRSESSAGSIVGVRFETESDFMLCVLNFGHIMVRRVDNGWNEPEWNMPMVTETS